MTRFIHDQFAKQYLTELLISYGQIEMSKDITSEVRQIDVLFTPASPFPDGIESLGLLGRMAKNSSYTIFEPFRNAVSKSEIRSCMGKLFDIHADLERQTKRNNTRINEEELPYLWIFTPTASADILESFNFTLDEENWGKGIYFLGKALKTVLIVIHQLPTTPETLFLRVLGRGKVQRQAVEELEALSENSPFLTNIIQLVHDLIAVLSARQEKEHDIDQDDQELIMKLSEMYEQQLAEIKKQEREEGEQQGLQKGRQEGLARERRAMIESILQVRFGELDSELATIIDQVIAMTREEFTPLLLQLSREELLARFTN
ncbi:MAG: hypothetical protein HEP80_09895 [Dolichospermum sp. UKL201]|jgi:hypothetical protein|uniref:hypothetical protein n=1 Tax=Dolichospermum lemmermannii TaxID=54295 RepID=UPI001AFCCA84|nr:hypothetical protein [Dolichospermum lemmermannii]MDB9437277.1 hypothetical protein [Dolichospermum lemmermannii CS-548]QSV54142.1 MAG: hypothetical protein HEP80_09895 [Dolichospermum sp. UKL201]